MPNISSRPVPGDPPLLVRSGDFSASCQSGHVRRDSLCANAFPPASAAAIASNWQVAELQGTHSALEKKSGTRGPPQGEARRPGQALQPANRQHLTGGPPFFDKNTEKTPSRVITLLPLGPTDVPFPSLVSGAPKAAEASHLQQAWAPPTRSASPRRSSLPSRRTWACSGSTSKQEPVPNRFFKKSVSCSHFVTFSSRVRESAQGLWSASWASHSRLGTRSHSALLSIFRLCAGAARLSSCAMRPLVEGDHLFVHTRNRAPW
jgi:hypothetical protein